MMLSREVRILLALLLVLAGLIVYRVATREEPKRVMELKYKPGVGAGPALTEGERPGNKVMAMKTERGPYRGVIKNPFQPLYSPGPPLPVILPKLSAPAPPAFPVITSKGPSSAQMDSGKVKFLGFLQKEGERKVFLSREKEVFIVKKGDGIGNLQVGEITDNSVTLLSTDGTEEFRLTIEDVKPTKSGILPGGGRR